MENIIKVECDEEYKMTYNEFKGCLNAREDLQFKLHGETYSLTYNYLKAGQNMIPVYYLTNTTKKKEIYYYLIDKNNNNHTDTILNSKVLYNKTFNQLLDELIFIEPDLF